MYEVEMKLRADHGAVRDALDDHGARSRGSITQRDTYYDAPTRDFADTDEALRIRRETNGGEETTRLTYKGPLVGEISKTREEYETTVGDGEALTETLDALGFAPVETVEKERERFSLAEYAVTLDSVTDLGEFVEIETEAREEEIDAAREGVVATLESLGLDPAEEIRTSYLELRLENAQ